MNLPKGEIDNNDLCPGECEGCPFNHPDLKGVESCSLIKKKAEETEVLQLMYDETFNPDDFESELEDNPKGPIEEELDIEFPTPKEGPSLDEMIRNYGIFVIEFSAKPLNNKQRLKKKNERE